MSAKPGRGAFIALAAALTWPLVASLRPAHAGGAIEMVAHGAAASLEPGGTAPVTGDAPKTSVVIAAPLSTDDAAPRADELALRVASLVAGKLGPNVRAHPQTAQLATARAIAGRASALVYVQTAIAKGDLRTTIDVYPSMANAWDRIRNPMPSPTHHAFATAKIDAEVRAFLTPLLLEQATVDRARHDEGDVLALGCGDLDGDGGNEIALLSAARVAIGRIRGDRFVVERAAAWDAIGPLSPVPMRDPLAGVVVAPGMVVVGSTSRGGVRLDADLRAAGPVVGVPAWGGEALVCLLPEPSAGAFDGAPVDCAMRRDTRPAMAVPAPRFDAFAAASLGDALGDDRVVVAVREPSGRLRLKSGDATSTPDRLVGAQVAVGDLDQDGQPEVATSAELGGAAALRVDDAVDVASWTSGGDYRARLHIAAPGGVRALAVCPAEAHGEPTLAAVVGSEVWLVRAAIQK